MNEIVAAANNRWGYGPFKKKNTQLCAWSAKAGGLRQIKNPVSVSIVWVEPNKKRDLDNIAAGCKFIFDGLVEGGILLNDTREWVRSIVHHFPDPDKEKPRVIVNFTEVAA